MCDLVVVVVAKETGAKRPRRHANRAAGRHCFSVYWVFPGGKPSGLCGTNLDAHTSVEHVYLCIGVGTGWQKAIW